MNIISANIIHNGTKFLDNPSTIIYNNDGKILDIIEGKVLENAKHYNGLLCPGFINTHCHLELSYLKNKIPQKTGLVEFIKNINSIRNNFDADFILQSIADAENEMIQNGIVAVGDISNTSITIIQKQKNNLHYHTFVEVAGVLDANAKQRLAFAQEIYLQFNKLHKTTIVPHAPYSVSNNLFLLINQLKNNNPITIHNQECIAEDNLIRNGNGALIPFLQLMSNEKYKAEAKNKSSLENYLPLLKKLESILFVHNTFTSTSDIDFAINNCKERNWVFCSNANLFIENKLPTIFNYLQNKNENICIGTDSLASNNSLSIYAEMQTINNNFKEFTPEIVLQWATANGAKALNMPLLGNLQINFKPHILNIENWNIKKNMPMQPIIKKII